MNYSGSYRKLFQNSKAAMLSAIEIYNKPTFDYRDEVFVILLINSWELLLKSIISKARQSIYYKKQRGRPYRTLSWQDALLKANETRFWSSEIPWQAVQANLQALSSYRDNAVHFYNAEGFGAIVYGLAHTAIQNFNELAADVFGDHLSDEMTWTLLPLGVAPPVDPIEYLKTRPPGSKSATTAVDEFLVSMRSQIAQLEAEGINTDKFLTVFSVRLESTKTISEADVIVGVDGAASGGGEPVYIERRMDPLITHPLRQKTVLEQVREVDGRPFNRYDFQAIAFVKKWKDDPRYCWHDPEIGTTRWARDVVPIIEKLTVAEIEEARSAYSARPAKRRG